MEDQQDPGYGPAEEGPGGRTEAGHLVEAVDSPWAIPDPDSHQLVNCCMVTAAPSGVPSSLGDRPPLPLSALAQQRKPVSRMDCRLGSGDQVCRWQLREVSSRAPASSQAGDGPRWLDLVLLTLIRSVHLARQQPARVACDQGTAGLPLSLRRVG